MHIRELYPDVIAEDLDYEYKQVLNPDNPVKWAKTIVGYANGKCGALCFGGQCYPGRVDIKIS